VRLQPGACHAGAVGAHAGRRPGAAAGRDGAGPPCAHGQGRGRLAGRARACECGSGERWPPPRWPPFALGPGTAPGSGRARAPLAPASGPAPPSPAPWRAAPPPAALPLLAPAPADALARAWPSLPTADAPPRGAPGQSQLCQRIKQNQHVEPRRCLLLTAKFRACKSWCTKGSPWSCGKTRCIGTSHITLPVCLHTCRGACSGCGRLRMERLIRLKCTRALRRPVPQRELCRRRSWPTDGRGRRLQRRRTLRRVHTEGLTRTTPCLRHKRAAGREAAVKASSAYTLRAGSAGSDMPLGYAQMPCRQHMTVPRHVQCGLDTHRQRQHNSIPRHGARAQPSTSRHAAQQHRAMPRHVQHVCGGNTHRQWKHNSVPQPGARARLPYPDPTPRRAPPASTSRRSAARRAARCPGRRARPPPRRRPSPAPRAPRPPAPPRPRLPALPRARPRAQPRAPRATALAALGPAAPAPGQSAEWAAPHAGPGRLHAHRPLHRTSVRRHCLCLLTAPHAPCLRQVRQPPGQTCHAPAHPSHGMVG
jgi:hypothetical protein